jgi:hypothetical protein
MHFRSSETERTDVRGWIETHLRRCADELGLSIDRIEWRPHQRLVSDGNLTAVDVLAVVVMANGKYIVYSVEPESVDNLAAEDPAHEGALERELCELVTQLK